MYLVKAGLTDTSKASVQNATTRTKAQSPTADEILIATEDHG